MLLVVTVVVRLACRRLWLLSFPNQVSGSCVASGSPQVLHRLDVLVDELFQRSERRVLCIFPVHGDVGPDLRAGTLRIMVIRFW